MTAAERDMIELAERCERAKDALEMDAICRDIHEIDEHSNVNGTCAAYLYALPDAKRLILEGRGYVLACDENRVWAKVVNMANDQVEGHSALRPGTFAETRALCAAALRSRSTITSETKEG